MTLTTRAPFAILAASVAFAAIASPADAIEFQYSQGVTNVSAGLHANSKTVFAPAFSFMQPVHSLTLVDNTGVLLSAMGNAAAAEVARRNAEEMAIDEGLKIGESYSYSWKEVPLREGAVSYIRYVWGSGVGASSSLDGATFTGGTLPSSVTGFEFGAPLGIWETGLIPVGFSMAAQWYSYQVEVSPKPPGGTRATMSERSAIRLPLTMSTAFNVLPSLFIRPTVSYDAVSGFGALLGSQSHGFLYELSAEYALINMLPIHASYVVSSGSTMESSLESSLLMLGASLRF